MNPADVFKPKDEGENKVTPLDVAVERNVKPGMTVHIGGEPHAALRQLLRQFWGKKPDIALIANGSRGPFSVSLIQCEIVSKPIISYYSGIYPLVGSPSELRTITDGRIIECENWSLYTIELRLMAGALGIGFMPTKSLVGTGMADENPDMFRLIKDPFDSDETIGVVKALIPDISIVHGCVADQYGNTILPLPYGDAIWGPRASRKGVIVTVENVVSTDFIREHSGLVTLPGHLVNAVCWTPFGAHPLGIANPHLEGFEPYEADFDFLREYDTARKDSDTLQRWIEKRVLKGRNHDDYLHQLGDDRIYALKQSAIPNAWKTELEGITSTAIDRPKFSSSEMLMIAAARKTRETILRKGYRTLLGGGGVAGIAAALAFYWLREDEYGIDMLQGLGMLGYMPLPSQPITSVVLPAEAKMLTDITTVYGAMVSGRNGRCLSVLSALEIDKFGNINNSKLGNRQLGAGGTADAVMADESLIVVKHSFRRFVDRVAYITAPGHRVKTIVSSLGIWEKLGKDEEFTLTACLPDSKQTDLNERKNTIKDKCDWDVKISETLVDVDLPSLEELKLLRLLDPHGAVTGK